MLFLRTLRGRLPAQGPVLDSSVRLAPSPRCRGRFSFDLPIDSSLDAFRAMIGAADSRSGAQQTHHQTVPGRIGQPQLS
jgi:hypothetical protein